MAEPILGDCIAWETEEKVCICYSVQDHILQVSLPSESSKEGGRRDGEPERRKEKMRGKTQEMERDRREPAPDTFERQATPQFPR